MQEESEQLPESFRAVAAIWNDNKGKAGLGVRTQWIIFCAACLLIISHRPDAIRNAQFYAEDGKIWFAQAYNFGWLHSLTLPQNGYFQTLPRLAAGLALLVPLRWAPLVMNSVGILLQALPVMFLLSTRLSNWGPIPLRCLWALAYLVLPNVMELEATITEGQWHLALLACLVILAQVPSSRWWRTFDIVVLLVSGLTGPFCLVLLPVAVVYWHCRRHYWRAILIGILAFTSLIELSAVFRTAGVARSQAPLGITPRLFFELLAGRVYMAALWGNQSLAAQQHLAVVLLMAIIGTAIVGYSLYKAEPEFRLMIGFCFAMLGLALSHPMASASDPQWQVLSLAAGQHYWFLPTLAFVWCLLWCSLYAPFWLATLCKLLAFTLPIGVVNDWRYPPYLDMHYPDYVQKFQSSRAASFHIPLVPAGWDMTLMNGSAACPAYPEGYLDAPKSGVVVTGMVTISGWVIAPGQHIKLITVKIDGQALPAFPPSIVRPDLDGLHPESPDHEKGWVTYFDSSSLTPGKHQLQVIATEKSGCAAEIAQGEMERAR